MDLVKELGWAKSTVSAHLSCLRECGLVDFRAVGEQSFYFLTRLELMDLLVAATVAWPADRHIELPAGVALGLTRNPGAAFSIGSDIIPVFTVIAVAMIAGIVWHTRKVTHRWAVALGPIAGGAAGNLVDRPFRAHKSATGGGDEL